MLAAKHRFFEEDAKDKFQQAVVFSEVVRSSSDVAVLYRGFKDIPKIMFCLPTVSLGLSGHRLPERVGMDEIELHKITNLGNESHLFSMTTDTQVAKDWGDNNYITIDPCLFRDYVIDVDKTYQRHVKNYPARFVREKEHVSLAVLYCSVKSITINKKEIANPFFIEIDSGDQAALSAFKVLYQDYLAFLINLRNPKNTDVNECATVFVKKYLMFYEKYGKENLMDNPLSCLAPQYDDYLKAFQAHSEVDITLSMKSHILKNLETLLSTHPYAAKLVDKKPFDRATVVTVYEDPWSYSNFD